MALLDSTIGGLLRAVDTGPLVEVPWRATSVALQTTTLVDTQSSEWRVPVLESDVSSGFVSELEEIVLTDPTLSECKVTPRKLASRTRLSRESAEDSSPATATVVGSSISRDLAFSTDKVFTATAPGAKDPDGLGTLVGNGAQAVSVVGSLVDLDPFIEAIGNLEAHGATATCFIADSRTWTQMALLRQFDGVTQSNVPLLGVDPSAPQKRSIQGVPCFSLRQGCLPVGQIWTFDRSRVFSVIRRGVEIAISADAAFSFDALEIRATTRLAWAFPDPAATCLITSGS